MQDTTFKDWLGRRVGDGEGQVSRRELARRLAEKDPSGGDPESYRRSIRRILDGQRKPSQNTRDAIQDALGDRTAPSVDDEEQAERDAMEAIARDPDLVKALMPFARLIAARSRT